MKLMFGADLVPTDITNQLFVEQDFKTLFHDVADYTKKADRLIVNLECALTNSENAIRKCGPNLKADPACADALKAFGVTDVMLSNNHVFDFGLEGLRDTEENLRRVGLPYTGVGENDTDSRKIYYFTEGGKKFAIVNVCEHEYSYALPDRAGCNPYDPYLTMHDIREAKKNAEIVIVIYHGGKEFCRYPSPRLRLLCHEMAECGADVVLTQHSHCIGCYEEYEGSHILYGQGNFHFVSPGSDEGWLTSLLVELDIDDKIRINFYPLVMLENGIDIAKGEKAKEIMDGFAARNEELKNGKWIDGWRAFCNSPGRIFYRNCLKGLFAENSTEHQNQIFAHYLDCEAHTDVWRELFPTWNWTNEK